MKVWGRAGIELATSVSAVRRAYVVRHVTKSVHDISVLIVAQCVQKHPINAHAYVSNGTRDLNFGPSLHLHPYLCMPAAKPLVSMPICTLA